MTVFKFQRLWRSRFGRLGLGVSGALVVGVVFHLFIPMMVHGGGGLTAFTVVTMRQEYQSTGETQATITEAFRASGSTATLIKWYWTGSERVPATAFEYKKIVSVPIQTSYLVISEAESVSSFKLSSNEAERFKHHKQCATSSGNDPTLTATPPTILGFDVVTRIKQFKLKNGQTNTITLWLAPELNYYPLRAEVRQRDQSGIEKIIQTVDTASVAVGEPDQGLFEIPSNYTERSPMAAATELYLRRGETRPVSTSLLFQRLEKKYRETK